MIKNSLAERWTGLCNWVAAAEGGGYFLPTDARVSLVCPFRFFFSHSVLLSASQLGFPTHATSESGGGGGGGSRAGMGMCCEDLVS